MKGAIECIQDDDPSFDPALRACNRAGVDYDLFTAAFDRVYCDGWYGPLNDNDWAEQDGRKPYSVKTALEILEKVSDEIEDYREVFYGMDEDGFEIEYEETTCEAEEIRRDLFKDIIYIYGRLPW